VSPSGPGGPLRVLLVDDHTVVREGLKRLFDPLADRCTITEAGTGFQALECLRRQTFDLAIVDLSMPGMSGLELTRRIKKEFPTLAVLVLTMHNEDQYAIRALQAGASGYVTKDTAATDLLAAVRKVAEGGAFLSPRLAERMVLQLNGQRPAPNIQTLSNRELDILQRIVNGQRLVDIADTLHLSIKTVSTHKRHIQEKPRLDSTAAMVRFGLEHRLGIEAVSNPEEDGLQP
jgi:two-component system invasion response regulator UvrY